MNTILLIDDDEVDQYLCERVFKRSDFSATLLTASDGVEALELLRDAETLPDLILLDINMPRMNGHEFLLEYSKLGHREIPVIVMLTSSDLNRDRDDALKHPAVQDYILKPFRKEMIEKLDALVKSVKKSLQ
ncbi:Response regulator receiver domain-containing protein [Neorhodopirellula lusitana]|uniref:Response regulator receiver domain-containing protein n=1 Tax=Neorhodopirellula lusitana TaxID=445327 RepID=A0ABY1QCJ7_9BACT|nr:response regulator [Neorhodopirellula lusitana]SMP67312.1 Response regulator receiver domain-containing protein [Neorhodopirellula lusitana]